MAERSADIFMWSTNGEWCHQSRGCLPNWQSPLWTSSLPLWFVGGCFRDAWTLVQQKRCSSSSAPPPPAEWYYLESFVESKHPINQGTARLTPHRRQTTRQSHLDSITSGKVPPLGCNFARYSSRLTSQRYIQESRSGSGASSKPENREIPRTDS